MIRWLFILAFTALAGFWLYATTQLPPGLALLTVPLGLTYALIAYTIWED